MTKNRRTKHYTVENGKAGRTRFSTLSEWTARIGKEFPCFLLRPICAHLRGEVKGFVLILQFGLDRCGRIAWLGVAGTSQAPRNGMWGRPGDGESYFGGVNNNDTVDD
jgi:hypothetical protein